MTAICLQVGAGIISVSIGWHVNHARNTYMKDDDPEMLGSLSKATRADRKVDTSLLPGLLAQLAPTISDEEQRQGLANMLASLPRNEREKTLAKVKTMSPTELKERSELHAQVQIITSGLSDEASAAFFKLLVRIFARLGFASAASCLFCSTPLA